MSEKPSFLPVGPTRTTLTPLGIDQAVLDGGFWGHRQSVNAAATIPHALHWETKVGWIDNFKHLVDGTLAENRSGREFSDSEVYKLIEAMAWEVGRSGDESLDAEIERLGELIEAAQADDGYVNTKFGNPGQEERYSDFAWGHELYCFGHLLQAAVARLRTGRDGAIVRVAHKVADHVCREFGEDGRSDICGHPEIEVALAEFGRATGESRYLEQARIFVERRGHQVLPDIEFGRSYYQDDVPFRDAEVLRGHAVRALYLASAAVDIAVELQDDDLLESAKRQFDAALARRTYITGGMGSHYQDEAFGQDFELPPDRAYCETCAGVGAVMVAWRLMLATGDMRYGDVIERGLYNIVATSPSEEGTAFFYANTLHRRTPTEQPALDVAVPRADSSLRAPWFITSCCPPNVARTFASLGALVATSTGDGVQIHQYVPGQITVPGTGGDIEIRVVTNYPHDGQIDIEVVSAPKAFDLDLRIPGWAQGATVDGTAAEPGAHRVYGVTIGSRISVALPMEPRVTLPDHRIDAIRGTVAIERGPLVFCLESTDLPDGLHVDQVAVEPDPQPRHEDDRVIVRGRRLQDPEAAPWPYFEEASPTTGDALDLTLVPYHYWANRGPSTMRIWIPVAID